MVWNVESMERINITIQKNLLEVLKKVAQLKGRSVSAQVRESLMLDPDIYEVLEGMKNE